MFNRFKKIVIASKLSDDALNFVVEQQDKLVSGEIAVRIVAAGESLSNGDAVVLEDNTKGEFLPDMTDAEVLEYERNERLGWKNFKLPWQS